MGRDEPQQRLVAARDAGAHDDLAEIGARAIDPVRRLPEEARHEHAVERHEPLPQHGQHLREAALAACAASAWLARARVISGAAGGASGSSGLTTALRRAPGSGP